LINYTGIGVTGLLQITNGANILDFEFGYTASKAYDLLTALGNDGRSFYIMKILPLDFPFPFTYMLCYAGWIALMGKYTIPKSALKIHLAAPVLAMLFDWIENIGILAMLKNYPLHVGCYDSQYRWYPKNCIYCVQFGYHDPTACRYNPKKSNA